MKFTILGSLGSIAAAVFAIYSIRQATKSIKVSNTIRIDVFMSNAFNELLQISSKPNISPQQLEIAHLSFLMYMEIACKYIVNNHSEKALTNSTQAYKEIIIHLKSYINGGNYPNIRIFCKRFAIDL